MPRATVKRSRRSMRERFTSGSVPFRKAYLQSLIDVVEVDDRQIRIKGSTDVLERAVLAGQAEDLVMPLRVLFGDRPKTVHPLT